MVTCYIALGSNLGDRQKNIQLALNLLKQDPAIKILKTSNLIETEPAGYSSPEKFLNGVVKLQTSYNPSDLLQKLEQIEIKLGRNKPDPQNSPRTIDLDILLYGTRTVEQEDLQIPHPRMWQRDFVTVPLREIAPELFEDCGRGVARVPAFGAQQKKTRSI